MTTTTPKNTSIGDGFRFGVGFLIVLLPMLFLIYRTATCQSRDLVMQEMLGCLALAIGTALLIYGLRLCMRRQAVSV